GAWIEGAIRLREQPLAPIRILFADLVYFRAAAPARAMIIPLDLDFADVAQHARADQVADSDLVGLAAMLRADLHDAVALEDRVAGSFGFFEHVGEGLLGVGVLAGLDDLREDRRVLEIASRDEDSVDIFERQQIIEVLERARRTPIDFLRSGGGLLAMDFPEIADGGHLDVLLVLKLRSDE